MGRKKDFWDLADSTILKRTKKVELLEISRGEHGQAEVYRAQLDLQVQQIKDQEELIEQLHIQLEKAGLVHNQVLEDLMQTFHQQQRNHEQELGRLQIEAKDWEKAAQDYKYIAVARQDQIDTVYRPLAEKVKSLTLMDLKDAIREFVKWLFPYQSYRG